MNEGCATYVHYRIMNRLHEQGRITDGNFLEFLQSHTNVVFQPEFDDPRYSGINPYALGFAMMQDIERIVTKPNDEDREWFPDIAGSGDAMAVLRDVWANYPRRELHPPVPEPAADAAACACSTCTTIRRSEPACGSTPSTTSAATAGCAASWRGSTTSAGSTPNIEVVDVDLAGDRRLMLHHTVVNGALLSEADTRRVLQHLADLWSYDVSSRDRWGRHDDEGVCRKPAEHRRGGVAGEVLMVRSRVAPSRTMQARWLALSFETAALRPPQDEAQQFDPNLPQTGVDLFQRGRAGAQISGFQRIERRLDGVEMGVQVFGVRIDIEQPGDDLALGGVLLQEGHGRQPVVGVVVGVDLAQRQPGAVMLLDHLHRARRVIDRDRVAAGDARRAGSPRRCVRGRNRNSWSSRRGC